MRLVLPLAVCLLAAACGPASFPWQLKTERPRAETRASEVSTDGPYNRHSARVLVRRIARPTRANLDHAAYHANMMIRDPAPETLGELAGTSPAGSELFGGALVPDSIVASIGATPLTAEEKARPMAFSPLVDFMSRWSYEKASALEDARAGVRTESWGLPRNVQITYQEIASTYLHGERDLWVKIEFKPWARLFEAMPDEDGDGHPEIYGKLSTDALSGEVFAQIRDVYAGEVLDAKAVRGWANELASYWYPSYNTDIYDLAGSTVWPIPDTEPEVVAALSGRKVENPTVVMRGKPHGKALYNVFVVTGMQPLPAKGKVSPASAAKRGPDDVSPRLEPQKNALEAELVRHGSFAKWAASQKLFHQQIARQLKKRPGKLKALIGRDGFLFFRNSLAYVVGGDLQAQPEGKNPFPAIVGFKDYLAGLGIDFLLVPIPTKAEVFPEKVVRGKLPLDKLPVLNPYGRKLLLELTGAGVEVVDLLPVFLAARASREEGDELLYQHQDTHWTDRGLQLAGRLVAERIKLYPWYADLAREPVAYSVKKVEFKQEGDLVSRLAEREKKRFKPATLAGHQVLRPDGELYEDEIESPIVILGDSFTGVFQRTYCRNAGVSAHIAKELKTPVDLVMSYGGGPSVQKTLLRSGEDDLRRRRLVVWMFAARDLYNYWEDWETIKR